MTDVAPQILESIKVEFEKTFEEDSEIKEILKKVKDKNASYKTADDFAVRVGTILSDAFEHNITVDVLPDGKMYFNIAERIIREPLTNNHNLVASLCAEIQTIINEEAGLGLKGILPDLNEELVKSMIDKMVSVDDFTEADYMLGEPVVNFTQSVVDDAVKTNAEFQYNSGLSPKIKRTSTGHCCKWCNQVAGTYLYEDAPKDVFRRHNYCKCTVEFIANGKKENVHTHKDTTRESRIQQIKDLEELDKRKKK